jgi:predicted XRE-type DNA-binding protein
MASEPIKRTGTERASGAGSNLKFRAVEECQTKLRLADAIGRIIEDHRLTQAAAAELLHVNQPKISALLHCKLEGFSVERLMTFLTALDHDVEISIKRKTESRPGGKISVVAAWIPQH